MNYTQLHTTLKSFYQKGNIKSLTKNEMDLYKKVLNELNDCCIIQSIDLGWTDCNTPAFIIKVNDKRNLYIDFYQKHFELVSGVDTLKEYYAPYIELKHLKNDILQHA